MEEQAGKPPARAQGPGGLGWVDAPNATQVINPNLNPNPNADPDPDPNLNPNPNPDRTLTLTPTLPTDHWP